ncbi:MAG TPA: DoxX family protein [Balneolaceae bacterium]|nr:DoxX family protein [Balneolaceae bacterium]
MSKNINRHKKMAYALLRITIGVIFLTFGATKLFVTGLDNFAGYMAVQFEGLIPAVLLTPFSYLLPFLEIILGLFLIVGFMSFWTMTATGALIAVLVFGAIMDSNPATVANNMLYGIVISFLIWNLKINTWSIDYKLGRTYE